MGLLTSEIVVSSSSYIFDGAGGMRDQLEQTIIQELDKKEYPLKVAVETVKSGGLFFGTKEQCVTINVSKTKRVVISNTTVGTYLYVTIYLLRMVPNNAANTPELVTDIFEHQHIQAAYAAAIESAESAFQMLNLKQTNSGYKRN